MAIAKGLPYIGIAPSLLKDPLKTLTAASKEGDVVQLKVPRFKIFLIHNPVDIKYVLENEAVYIKGSQVKPFKKLFGTSVLTTEGDEWKQRRTIVQPAFHHHKLQHFTAIFRDETLQMLESWAALPADRAEIDCSKEMKHITQSIIVKTLFGTDLQHIKGYDIFDALENVFASLNHVIWSSSIPKFLRRLLPGENRHNENFKRGMDTLHQVIAILIRHKREQTSESHDLIQMLLNSHFDDGTSMADAQIYDEVITFFSAGHDTSPASLTWAWIFLAQHPEIQARMHEELDAIDHPLTFEDLPNLTYTRSVFYEALRMRPPAWFIPRTTQANDQIRDTVIPRKSIIILCPYLAHHHPEFWPNPDCFDPERFSGNLRNPEHFHPFGAGRRQCIAKEYVFMEGPLILGNIAKKYSLRLKYPEPIIPQSSTTLFAKQQDREGIMMTIHKR